MLAQIGRPNEGLAFSRRGLTLDPLSPQKTFGSAGFVAAAGLTDEARALMDKARRIWPDGPNNLRFTTAFAVDFVEPQEGLALLADLRTQHPEFTPEADIWSPALEALRCRCGQAQAANRIKSATLAGQLEPAYAWPLLVRLGDLDDAYQLAERKSPTGNPYDDRLLFSKVAAPLRTQPRFMDLAARLGLAQFWIANNRWPEFCATPNQAYDCKSEAIRAAGALKSNQSSASKIAGGNPR